MSQRLLSAAEAAEFLGVKKPTIYALTKNSELPVFIIGRSHFRYDPADLEKYIQSRKVPELAKAISEKNGKAGLLGQQELQKRRAEAA
jgi:excisionase family DNA binding protein